MISKGIRRDVLMIPRRFKKKKTLETIVETYVENGAAAIPDSLMCSMCMNGPLIVHCKYRSRISGG
jgi:hypothetical protein